ncbi:MAG TPA: hypothetical protein PK595_06530 [Bacteroidota bacterium]|nr:hypothetical protein [Bacteroidota bacterium]
MNYSKSNEMHIFYARPIVSAQKNNKIVHTYRNMHKRCAYRMKGKGLSVLDLDLCREGAD